MDFLAIFIFCMLIEFRGDFPNSIDKKFYMM